MLTRSFMGTDSSKNLLAYTPMIHSRMFNETSKFRDHHFQPTRAGLNNLPNILSQDPPPDPYLDGNPSIDRPLITQFCANSPDDLLDAARYVEPYCDAVDLNLGCPQGIARKGKYGAFLQEDWDLIYKLINKLHIHLDVPVTAKMRILETKERTLQYAEMILSAGASIISVHGRQREQKGHKTGLADWSVIRYLREHLPSDTVIFANGNILRHQDIQQCLDETGADGVMSAEGNLYDPTIFAKPPAIGEEGSEYWRNRDGKGGYRMDAVFRRYMDIIYQYVLETPAPDRQPLFVPSKPLHATSLAPAAEVEIEDSGGPHKKRQKLDDKKPKTTSPNLLAIQAHLFHLLRPLVAKHHDVRDALAKSRAGDILAFENVLRMVEEAVKDGLVDYESNPEKYEEPDIPDAKEAEENKGKDESSLAAAKACKRPWWVCQPYVRPLPKEALENGSLTMSKKDKRKLEEERILEKAEMRQKSKSEREEVDKADGMVEKEMPKESMVCG